MLRNDLSAAELRIVWYILTNAIAATGTARISNQHLESALRLSHTTVVRAKKSLRQKKLLSWRTEGPFSDLACDYSIFLQKEEVRKRTSTNDKNGPSQGPFSDLEQTKLKPATQEWLADKLAQHEKARAAIASDDPRAIQQFNKSAWRRQ